MYWKHNCQGCKHITSFEMSHRYGNKWDLYTHDWNTMQEIVLRHGNEPEEYVAYSKDDRENELLLKAIELINKSKATYSY